VTEANELADAIYKLPIEHRGEMYKNQIGKPVYMNVEEFQEVFSEFIFDESYKGLPDGSVFDWKQVDGIGFKQEFDKTMYDAKAAGGAGSYNSGYLDLGYESAVAVHIQEELALLEQICTLVSYETPIDNDFWFCGNQPAPLSVGFLGARDPYFLSEQDLCGNVLYSPGPPLKYSDLSREPYDPNWNLHHRNWYIYLNQVPETDSRYIDYEDILETRPLSLYYLEHLNGIKVYDNAVLKGVRSRAKTAFDAGDLTQSQYWQGVALLPLFIKNIFDFIPWEHRRLLANAAFRYYTIKYFGDYTGFKIADPHDMSSTEEGRDILNTIFTGEQVSIPWSYATLGVFTPAQQATGIPLKKSGEFFGEVKGIADMIFVDDQSRRDLVIKNEPAVGIDWASSTPIHFEDPIAKFYVDSTTTFGEFLEDIKPIWGRTQIESASPGAAGPEYSLNNAGFDSQEEFERYMLFGLFFGFDVGAKWGIIMQQHEDYILSGDNFGPWDFRGKHVQLFMDNPSLMTSDRCKTWTSSYQRDLFNAMQLYKNGMPELDLPSPLEIFANDVLVTDTLEFADKASENALTKPASIYAEEASYGIRLSHLLPQDQHSDDDWRYPLSNSGKFYPMIKNSVNGVDPAFSSDLLAMKRLKAYGVREYLDLQLFFGGTAATYTDAPGFLTFLLPLLQQEHEVTNSKTLYQLLQENWHEKTNWKQDDRSNHLSLYNEMKKKDEFRLLFDYVFPVKRILSIATIHNFLSLDGIINKSDQAGEQEDIFKKTIDLISSLSTTKKS